MPVKNRQGRLGSIAVIQGRSTNRRVVSLKDKSNALRDVRPVHVHGHVPSLLRMHHER